MIINPRWVGIGITAIGSIVAITLAYGDNKSRLDVHNTILGSHASSIKEIKTERKEDKKLFNAMALNVNTNTALLLNIKELLEKRQ